MCIGITLDGVEGYSCRRNKCELAQTIWQLSRHFKLLVKVDRCRTDWHSDKKWATCEKVFHFVSLHKQIVGFLAVPYASQSDCLNELLRTL